MNPVLMLRVLHRTVAWIVAGMATVGVANDVLRYLNSRRSLGASTAVPLVLDAN